MDAEPFSLSPDDPILVIGAAGQDIIGRPRDLLQPGSSNPGRIRLSFGGVSRNVAENLARMGQPVRLITAVGADRTGDNLLEQAEDAGVDIQYSIHSDRHSSGAYLALVDERGWLQYALDDMRVISALTPSYIESMSGLFAEASLVFVDANLAKETLRKIFTLARKFNLPVCADPTSILLANRLKPFLKRIKLITPNLAEAQILCERSFDLVGMHPGIEAAKSLISLGVEIAIVSLAELGVGYATSETTGQVPALRTEVVDPTGGGDAMTAAVIYALLNKIPLDDAIRLGVSAASLTLRYAGAVVPDLSLQKLYDRLVI